MALLQTFTWVSINSGSSLHSKILFFFAYYMIYTYNNIQEIPILLKFSDEGKLVNK